MLQDLGAVLESLAAVPVIDGIASAMSDISLDAAKFLKTLTTDFEQLKRDIINPITAFFDDTKKGLGSITSVVSGASQRLPEALNTVQILMYLSEVASPLAAILKGDEAGKRLKNVLDTMNTTKNAVADALKPFAEILKTIGDDVRWLALKMDGIFDAIGDEAKTAMKGLQSAAKALKPVTDGFNKAMDAIKPVKWALDAVSSVVQTVLMPVIDWILKVTGLDKLVDDLKKSLMKQLGVKPIIDAVQGNVDAQQVKQNKGRKAHSSRRC